MFEQYDFMFDTYYLSFVKYYLMFVKYYLFLVKIYNIFHGSIHGSIHGSTFFVTYLERCGATNQPQRLENKGELPRSSQLPLNKQHIWWP